MRDLPRRFLRKSLFPLWLLAAIAICLPAYAQQGGFRDSLGLKGKLGGSKPVAQFEIDLTESEMAGEAILSIKATIPAEHYIYSTNDNGGAETYIDIKSVTGLAPIDEAFTPDHAPKLYHDPALERTVEKFYDQVTWVQKYRLQPGVKPADVSIKGQIKYQICDKHTCRPNIKVPIDVTLTAAAVASPTASEPGSEPTKEKAVEEEEDSARPGLDLAAPISSLELTKTPSAARPVPEFRTRLQPGAGPDELLLEITAVIPSQYHIYSTEEKGTARTEIIVDKVAGLEPLENEFKADH
ncbi:MAG TPA: hypothetical protein VL475_03940, partial [Planctomycetaceae bacterium]|nr:hypothetical protein [Planctomycetaceae bacterium]